MKQSVANWIANSDYDYDTAVAMFDSGRYLYVAFTCQQSIEKILKAFINFKTNQTPPYIHNLNKLFIISELQLSTEFVKFLDELNFYYIEGRYSENVMELAKGFKKEYAEYILTKTKELHSWILHQIK